MGGQTQLGAAMLASLLQLLRSSLTGESLLLRFIAAQERPCLTQRAAKAVSSVN